MTIYGDITLDFQCVQTFEAAQTFFEYFNPYGLPISYDNHSLQVNTEDLELKFTFEKNDNYYNLYEIKDFIEGVGGQTLLHAFDLMQGDWSNPHHTLRLDASSVAYDNNRNITTSGREFDVIVDEGAVKAHVELTTDYYDHHNS